MNNRYSVGHYNVFNLIMLMIFELFIGTVNPGLLESCESLLKPVLLLCITDCAFVLTAGSL